MADRRCSDCEKWKEETTNFGKRSPDKNGRVYYKSVCNECGSSRATKWHKDNRDHANKVRAKWERENKERVARSRLKSAMKSAVQHLPHSEICEIINDAASGILRECKEI